MSVLIEEFEFHDMGQYMELATGFTDVLSIQLQPGKLCMQNRVLKLDGITVTHYSCNLRLFQRLSVPKGHVMFVLTAPAVNGCNWCGIEVPSSSLAILHPGEEHRASIPQSWDTVEILISNETLFDESLLSESLWKQTLQPNQALFSGYPSRIQLFRLKLLRYFNSPERLGDLAKCEYGQSLLKNQILEPLGMILMEIEMNVDRYKPISQSRRRQTFFRALEMVEANVKHPLTIQEVCDRIGTTPRTLQLTFLELSGVSPSQYILSRKLHAVQQDLFKAQGDSIPIFQKAQEYGIQHAGRFSQQYKRMFNESPSDTVKRRLSTKFTQDC